MGPRLLIIDDHPRIAETLRGLLEDEGYEVVTATNGAAGLVAVAGAQPSLVISDIMMPVLDGRAFLKRLRESPATATLPVILVSAAEALSAVDDDHAVLIRKPFKLQLLLDQIERFLRK